MNVVCYDGNKLVDELRLDEGNNISNELQLGYGLQSTAPGDIASISRSESKELFDRSKDVSSWRAAMNLESLIPVFLKLFCELNYEQAVSADTPNGYNICVIR